MEIGRAPSSSSTSPLKLQQPQHRSGDCYSCKSPGHWARDCPSKLQDRSKSITQPQPTSDFVFPDMLCPHKDDICIVKTSRTEKNPDRKYYQCRTCRCNTSVGNVKEFLWCDRLLARATERVEHKKCPCGAGWCNRIRIESGENSRREYFKCPNRKDPCAYFRLCKDPSSIQYGHPETYPMCSCGAGRSRLYIDGSCRMYFGCTVLKGQGACNFIQWCDSDESDIEMASSGYGNAAYNYSDQHERNEHASVCLSDGPCPKEKSVEAITLDGEDAEILEILYSKLAARTPATPSLPGFH